MTGYIYHIGLLIRQC